MKKYIPKNIINEIIEQTNIIEIISSHIKIIKKGKYYQALCPFHNEKIPSFTINEKKQFYYCFGCNANGNIIDFLINFEKINFIEAIEYLAQKNNINIFKKKKNINIYKKRQYLFNLINKISNKYHLDIKNSKNKLGIKYLKKRKIKKKMINIFNIGFSLINFKKKHINIKKKNIKKKIINLGILIKKNNGKVYDLLYKKITFPIRNKQGQTIGFGARAINNTLPKYLNSAETKIFNKKKQLYGLYESIKINPNPKYIIVVEGYLDVITLFQYNITCAVAILGTNLSKEHIKKLFQYTNKIIYCYDGDKAGKRASWNTVKKILPYLYDKYTIKFIFLPKNQDPDTIIRKEGRKEFKKRIKNAIDFSSFIFKKLLKKNKLNNIETRKKFCSIIIPYINKIPGKIIRFYLYKKLGDKIGILDINKLYQLKNIKKKYSFKKKKIKKNNINILISLLIQNPSLGKIIPSIIEINFLKFKKKKIFIKILKICINKPKITTGQILEIYRGKKKEKKIKKLAIYKNIIKKKNIKILFLDILIQLYNKKLEKIQNKIIEKDRKKKIKKIEKYEFWLINKEIKKNK